jgi:hypothetical protein
MPKVYCTHCGEELLGSVNRCWRCGREFVAEHNPENLPPIRRRPIPLELVNKTREEREELQAAPSHRPALAAVGAESSPAASPAIEAVVIDDEPESDAADQGKSGDDATESPPAPVVVRAVPPATPFYTAPSRPAYPTNAGATGGAIAAVVLGVMALVALRFIAPGALLVSILGVSMGVWGLHSDRRGVALFGLVLCCLAMALAGFFTAVGLFELINGYNPFEADLPPIDPDSF